MTDLEKAKAVLSGGEYTCVFVQDGNVHTSTERGVKPLLEYMDNGERMKNFAAADKVVGLAAAYIYVLLEPSCLYAGVISRPAFNLLQEYGIKTEYGQLTDAIINRSGTGFCPMETAVKYASGPREALDIINKKINNILSLT